MTYRIKKELVKTFDEFIDHLVERIFKGHTITNVDGEIDYYRRIYVETTNGSYCVRTWNIKETMKSIVVDFSIYEEEEN